MMEGKLSRAAVASLCLLALVGSPGCFGKSVATTSVVKWHHGIETDKYVKEGIYLPIFFLVLPITALVDNFILNAVDFWTKDDPLSAGLTPEGSRDGTLDGRPRLAWEPVETVDGPRLVAVLPDGDGSGRSSRIVVGPGEAVVEDADGRVLVTAKLLADGSVAVTDLRNGTERKVAPTEVASLLTP